MGKCYPTVSDEYKKAVEQCKKKLRDFFSEKILVEERWLLEIYFQVEFHLWYVGSPLDDDGARRLLEPIKKLFPILSYGDFHELARIVLIQTGGGPEIPFHPGRKDKIGRSPKGCLIDASRGYARYEATQEVNHRVEIGSSSFSPLQNGMDSNHLRDMLGHMDLSEKDIVALSGALALGRYDNGCSGSEGTPVRLIFDNSYFKELLRREKEGLIVLPFDNAFLTDSAFRPLVEKYAADKNAFFADYVEAHLKLSEMEFADAEVEKNMDCEFMTIDCW